MCLYIYSCKPWWTSIVSLFQWLNDTKNSRPFHIYHITKCTYSKRTVLEKVLKCERDVYFYWERMKENISFQDELVDHFDYTIFPWNHVSKEYCITKMLSTWQLVLWKCFFLNNCYNVYCEDYSPLFSLHLNTDWTIFAKQSRFLYDRTENEVQVF